MTAQNNENSIAAATQQPAADIKQQRAARPRGGRGRNANGGNASINNTQTGGNAYSGRTDAERLAVKTVGAMVGAEWNAQQVLYVLQRSLM
jgi:hypothetical protein